jgi:hypothetical protein
VRLRASVQQALSFLNAHISLLMKGECMPSQQSRKQLKIRAAVAVGGGAILALIGVMGVMMGWSLYFKTFSTYSKFFQNLFAFGTAAILECALFWFGVQLIKSAASWAERGCAIAGAMIILTIIGLNIATHNAITRGASLSVWQANYINYFGPAVIAVVALMVIVQLVLRPEVQQAFRDSMRDFETQERLDDIETQVLDSPEFDRWMRDNFQEEIYRRAAGRAGYDAGRHSLPAAPNRPALYADTAEGEIHEEQPRYVNGAPPHP